MLLGQEPAYAVVHENQPGPALSAVLFVVGGLMAGWALLVLIAGLVTAADRWVLRPLQGLITDLLGPARPTLRAPDVEPTWWPEFERQFRAYARQPEHPLGERPLRENPLRRERRHGGLG